ncbi:MAG: acyl carrier protein [Clostridia bacterium]|nr:acyl carrier protein [Clostridia bacterium]
MTEQKVKNILAKQLGVDEAKINANTNIATDLGADSLDLVEILMTLEEEFSVSIPDEAIPNIKTVADLVAFIDKAK